MNKNKKIYIVVMYWKSMVWKKVKKRDDFILWYKVVKPTKKFLKPRQVNMTLRKLILRNGGVNWEVNGNVYSGASFTKNYNTKTKALAFISRYSKKEDSGLILPK